jgi:hypothetical protein
LLLDFGQLFTFFFNNLFFLSQNRKNKFQAQFQPQMRIANAKVITINPQSWRERAQNKRGKQ